MCSDVAKQVLPKDFVISGVSVLESKLLGEGAYGVVQLGKYYGLLCAVKKLKSSMFPAGMKQLDQQTELILQSFYNECDKLSKIRHPNVVQLLGVYDDKKTRLPVIVMELMNESLTKLLYRTKALSLSVEVNICHDVAQALAYLHSFKPPIVHRDLSSNNILLSEHLRAKITDLGVAKFAKGSFLNWDHTPAPGTMAYMPPEVRKVPADLTPAMDVFALGVNAVQIRTHKFPRPGPEFVSSRFGFSKMVPEKERRRDHIDLMGRTHPLKQLAVDCLQDNPRDRPMALQVCERFEKVKETRQYVESLQIGHVKDTKVTEFRQQICGLEQTVTQLREELSDKVSEVDRLKTELNQEREYTAHILEERTRESLQQQIRQTGVSMSVDNTENTKKKRPLLKLKRLRSFIKIRSSNSTENGISDDARCGDSLSPQDVQSEPGNGDLAEPVLQQHNNDIKPSPKLKKHQSLKTSVSTKGQEHVNNNESEKTKHLFKNRKFTWYSHNCLPQGLQGSTLQVHVFNDKIGICGGATSDGLPNKALYYCQARNITRWMRAHQDVPQYYGASAIINGEPVLIGGLSAVNGKCTDNLASYDFKSHLWFQQFPPMPTSRSSADACVFGDYLVVIGGQNDNGEALDAVEVMHLPTKVWGKAASLPVKLAGQSVTICDDVVYAVGGSDGCVFLRSVYSVSVLRLLASCNRFSALPDLSDSFNTTWKKLQDCPFSKMSTTCSSNQLLAFGGEEVTKSANSHLAELVWLYDQAENAWTPIQCMPTPRKLCAVAVMPDGNIVVFGGEPDYNRIDIAETH